MFNRLKKCCYKFYKIYIKRTSYNDYYISIYRRAGMLVGRGCSINSILPSGRDAFLIEIGNNVTISTGVKLYPHDASIGNITNFKYTDLFGKIIISDNCFIGGGAIILPGVKLGKKTIVAAGSVVTKSVEKEGLVIGGNPAKVLCTVDEFLKKNLPNAFNVISMSDNEIKILINSNKEKLIKKPEM